MTRPVINNTGTANWLQSASDDKRELTTAMAALFSRVFNPLNYSVRHRFGFPRISAYEGPRPSALDDHQQKRRQMTKHAHAHQRRLSRKDYIIGA